MAGSQDWQRRDGAPREGKENRLCSRREHMVEQFSTEGAVIDYFYLLYTS
jgi:hypothetical protein